MLRLSTGERSVVLDTNVQLPSIGVGEGNHLIYDDIFGDGLTIALKFYD